MLSTVVTVFLRARECRLLPCHGATRGRDDRENTTLSTTLDRSTDEDARSPDLLGGGFERRVPLPGGLSARVLGAPARLLPHDALGAIVAEMAALVGRATGGPVGYGVFAPRVPGGPHPLDHSVVALVRDRAGRLVGFNVMPVLGLEWFGGRRDVLHLGLVIVDPETRSRGLTALLYGLACVIVFLRNGLRPIHVSSVTQVPAVFGMVASTYSDVFPGEATRASFEQRAMARRIMQAHRLAFGVGGDARFDAARFVIENAYTGGSDELKKRVEDLPMHREARFNDACLATLDYERGDDFLQLGRLDLGAARRYVTRFLPARSMGGLAASGALTALQSLVLPVMAWFDPTRAFGELAARGLARERARGLARGTR